VNAGAVTAVLSLGLVGSLLPSMTFPATMPAVVADLGLGASEAGWIGGIYFAGYAGAVPLLATLTDRVGAKRIYLLSCILGAVAGLAFAGWAETFWTALSLRFVGGIALAGVHMPGLKLLTDLLGEGSRVRATGIYSSSYALGSAASYFLAGLVETALGWPAAFAAAGIGPAAAGLLVAALPAPAARAASLPAEAPPRIELKPLLTNRAFMAYVAGYAGNTWEVFSIRVWFVACLAWTANLPGNHVDLPPLGVLSGAAALAGVPASILVSELALRLGREKVIAATCAVSVAVCLALSAAAGGPILLVLALLMLLQVTSFADVGALAAGAVAASEPGRRGASLALYAFAGSMTGFIGPVVVGTALDRFGGLDTEAGWAAAFLVMALGSVAAGLAVRSGRAG
jgi:MFS family permease